MTKPTHINVKVYYSREEARAAPFQEMQTYDLVLLRTPTETRVIKDRYGPMWEDVCKQAEEMKAEAERTGKPIMTAIQEQTLWGDVDLHIISSPVVVKSRKLKTNWRDAANWRVAVKELKEQKATGTECECGGEKANTPHSGWCPKYDV